MEVQTKEIETKTNSFLDEINGFQVETEEQYKQGCEMVKTVNSLKKEVVSTFKEPKQKAHEAHKAISKAEKLHKEPLEKAEQYLRGKLGFYIQEQERIEREERLRLQAIEQKKEEERKLKEAEQLEEMGETEEAEQVMNEEVVIPYVPEKKVEKVEGVSFRETWDYEIKDINKIPRQYLIVDTKKVGQIVRALKGETSIEGIRVFSKKTTAIRG